jgi:multidrug resistance protein
MTMSLGATVVSLFSTLYTSGIPGLQEEFHISKIVALLGITTYLLGMATGSIVFAPLSEVVGRRPVYIVSMTIFLALILPSALASNIESILASRFFGGFFGSAMMSNSPASVNDIVSDEHRALAFGFWSIGPTNGPVYGPIIGGFVFEYLGWRWTNWIVLIIGGLVLMLMVSIKETYTPVILRKRAEKQRKETQNPKWWTRYDGGQDFKALLSTSLSRPFVMIMTEPIWYETPIPSLSPATRLSHLLQNLKLIPTIVFSGIAMSRSYMLFFIFASLHIRSPSRKNVDGRQESAAFHLLV